MTKKTDEAGSAPANENPRRSPWLRLIYLIMFAVILNVMLFIICVLAVIQFVSRIATGGVNENLKRLGHMLGIYVQQIIEFMTCYDDLKPYPFSTWPTA